TAPSSHKNLGQVKGVARMQRDHMEAGCSLGRAGLATSFAAYKFLINYATTMSALELTQFYFSVIVPQAVWILIDSFIAVGLCIALTQAQTARTLAPSRPTARLIGSHTLASIWGQTAINYAFLFGLIGLLFNQHWFRCNEFDSRDIDTSLWWILGDNYESELISIVCLFQFVNAAAVYNFGYRYPYEKLVVLGPVGRYIKSWWIRRKSDHKPKLKL
ncbi:hypothetical protein GGI10_004196, partial [Coemansia sp. RSA 2530]